MLRPLYSCFQFCIRFLLEPFIEDDAAHMGPFPDQAFFIISLYFKGQDPAVDLDQLGFTKNFHSYRSRRDMPDIQGDPDGSASFLQIRRHPSMRAIMDGVAYTSRRPLPTALALLLFVTISSFLFLIPVSSMSHLLFRYFKCRSLMPGSCRRIWLLFFSLFYTTAFLSKLQISVCHFMLFVKYHQ